MEERTKLRQELEVGNALSELRNHHGWVQFSRMVQDYFAENVSILIDHEDQKARAIVTAITELNERFELGIALARNAAEVLKQDKFKEPWGAAE